MLLLSSMKSIVFSRWLFVFAVNWKHSRGFSMLLTRILRTAVLKLCEQHSKNITSPCFHSSKVSRLALENLHSTAMPLVSALETGGERIQDIPSGSVDTSESQWILRSFGHLVRTSTEVIEHFFSFDLSDFSFFGNKDLISNSTKSNYRHVRKDGKRWECFCEVQSDNDCCVSVGYTRKTRPHFLSYRWHSDENRKTSTHARLPLNLIYSVGFYRNRLTKMIYVITWTLCTLKEIVRCRLYHRRICFPTTILDMPSLKVCRLLIDSFL